MSTLSKYDLHFAVNRLPKVVLEAMKKQGTGMVVAGGYIRSIISGEKVADVDIFSPTKDLAQLIASQMASGKGARLIETDNAYTVLGYGFPIQFIHRWTFGRPEEVVPSFDFTIARAAFWYDGNEWQSLCDESFYQDLAAKRLVYCAPQRNEDAGGSLLRVLKFYQRGYRIPLGSLGAVLGRMIADVPEEKFTDRKGMAKEVWEGQIGHVLTGLLREVDPLYDPEHLAHISEPPAHSAQLQPNP